MVQVMTSKPNILFICTVNRMRSATAERLYAHDERFYVDSAGTDPLAEVPLDAEALEWADYILVMESVHRRKIKQQFPRLYSALNITCLNIPDNYDYMEPALIELLQNRVEQFLRSQLEWP
jgi:predicted protein tyrosine phosphatase